jgi:chromosome segregation and condensation protein ScpB
MTQDNDRSRDPAQFSDKALSVLVFAAYHQLASGERVTEVVHHDNAGHSADQQGVEELRAAGLVRFDGRMLYLEPQAQNIVETLIARLRG